MKQFIKKNPTIEHYARKCYYNFKKSYMYMCNKWYGVDENKAVFISFNGKSYSDNPKAISEKLHEMCPDFKIVWLFNNPDEKRNIMPNYVECVDANSMNALKELATAKIWVDNFQKSVEMYKSEEQVYIQTWHGDRGFKKVLRDSSFHLNDTYIESKICDLAVSGSDYGERVYRTAFEYAGKILKVGSPRNDILIQGDIDKKEKIKRNFGVEAKTKILLYAPTLRRQAANQNELQSAGEINLPVIIETLKKTTHENWCCFVRAHSAVKGLSGITANDNIFDVSSYEDMNNLLLASDFLITDYSSSAGDFALLNRPIVLFQADREQYLIYDRTFYFDIEKSPYLVVKNQNELVELINKMDWNKIPQNCREILDFYGTFETGEASKKVVEYVLSAEKG